MPGDTHALFAAESHSFPKRLARGFFDAGRKVDYAWPWPTSLLAKAEREGQPRWEMAPGAVMLAGFETSLIGAFDPQNR
jgi:hypothetical protein